MAYTPIDTDNAEFQNALKLIQYTRQSVFLTGKAGTGKSTFLKHVCQITKKNLWYLPRQALQPSMQEEVPCTAFSSSLSIPSCPTIPTLV